MSIDFKDNDYLSNIKYLDMVNDVYQGTRKIKNSKTYLNKRTIESDTAYNDRLKFSTFQNILRKSIDNLASILLRKKPIIDFKANSKFLVDNFDGKGTNIFNFTKELSVAALRDGMCYIWCDSEKIEAPLNLLTAKGIRPFNKILLRKDVISKRTGVKNGEAYIKQMVIKQKVEKEINEFETELVDIFIVLRENGGIIYDEKEEIIGKWTNNLGYVPVIPVYSAKTGYLSADIPLLDLADMNIEYFNKYSELQRTLSISASPIACIFSEDIYTGNDERQKGSGVDKVKDIAIGAETAIVFRDKTTQGFEWKEPHGQAILHLMNNLVNIRTNMINLASGVLSEKKYMTATEVKVNEDNNNLFLMELSYSIESALNAAIKMNSDFLGKTIDIKVETNKDFELIPIDANMVDKFIQMKREGFISTETFFRELIKGEIIADLDIEKEKMLIESEMSKITAM